MSATYALLFFGLLFAMGTLHAAASNTAEEITAAQQFQNDHLATVQGTSVNVTDVELLDPNDCDVTVEANNTGETTLSVDETDVFADGVYEEHVAESASVEGDGDTDLWLPGQQLRVDLEGLPAAPDRIKVVSGPGVADATEVTDLTC